MRLKEDEAIHIAGGPWIKILVCLIPKHYKTHVLKEGHISNVLDSGGVMGKKWLYVLEWVLQGSDLYKVSH